MFCQLAVSSSKVDLAKINSSIYAVTFLAQSSKGEMCHLCLEADHGQRTVLWPWVQHHAVITPLQVFLNHPCLHGVHR